MQQPERKRKNYQPYPGFYDLRLFDLNPKQFAAAWRVQEYLYRESKCRAYYRQYTPERWTELQDLSVSLQMFLLPLLKGIHKNGKDLKQ